MSYLAVDPEEVEEASYEVSSETIDQAASFRLSDEDLPYVSATRLVNAAVRASWATLADFGGNLSAMRRWAPAVMERRLERQQPERISFDTPFGAARGTSISFVFQGRQLNVRYGIGQTVDRRLTENVAESITEAQSEFAQRLAERQDSPDRTSDELDSATSDGSIFSLRLS